MDRNTAPRVKRRLALGGKALERVAIFSAGASRDLRRQLGSRRLLVPVQGLQVIAYKLLVEARRTGARRIGVSRPEARRVRGKQLIDKGQSAIVIQTKLELGIRDDNAAR